MEEKIQKLASECRVELINILDYWQKNTIDTEGGGFVGKIDQSNRVIAGASKGAVLNARILWTFAAAGHFMNEEQYIATASRAYEYLKAYFLDVQHGGLIWEVDHLGRALNTRKQTYAQGFGIYGFSEYYRATGHKESLEIAIDLYRQIEKHCYDEEYGGYVEALSKEWGQMEDMRLSPKDANYPKSMNTHLHILEPYTNLYRVWPDEGLASQMKKLIRTFLDHIIDPSTGHFRLFFERDWTVKSEIISYGHDIEGAWLLTEAAEILEEPSLLEEVETVALKMTGATLAEGMAPDGSVYYEREAPGGHLDTDRHWWPQAEALVGMLNAWQISKNDAYLIKAVKCWDFTQNYIIDKERGEWYWRVNDKGMPYPEDEKAGFWKCPYHNSRACMEAIRRIKSQG